jgi:hypothetical protein
LLWLLLLVVLLVFGRYPTSSSHHLYQDINHNDLNKKPPETIGACQGLTYTSPPVQHRPIWIASYPGSGAEMVRDLVEALTGGLVGGSVYTKRDPPFMDCITAQAATCKTHWPILPLHSPLLVTEQYDPHAIVLVRNPIPAFASRLNHLWEVKTETEAHTRQAPERAWNQWIQKNWKHQLEKYHELIHTWTNTSFPYKVELVLAYEDLIQATTNNSNSNGSRPLGALTAQRLVSVLQRSNVRVVQGPDNVECLWRQTVVQKPKKKRAKHVYTPGYTLHQRDRIRNRMETDLLQPLLDRQQQQQQPNPVEQELIRIFRQYKDSIQNNTRIIKY